MTQSRDYEQINACFVIDWAFEKYDQDGYSYANSFVKYLFDDECLEYLRNDFNQYKPRNLQFDTLDSFKRYIESC